MRSTMFLKLFFVFIVAVLTSKSFAIEEKTISYCNESSEISEQLKGTNIKVETDVYSTIRFK